MQREYAMIGESAGRIYDLLKQQKDYKKSLSDLQKETGLETALLHRALGWLAREGNVGFESQGRQQQVTLIRVSAEQ